MLRCAKTYGVILTFYSCIISIITCFHLKVFMKGVDGNQHGMDVIAVFHVKQNILAAFCQL